MTIDEILNTLPSREDLVKAIGLQTRDPGQNTALTAVGAFSTGVLVGAGLALLYAWKTEQNGHSQHAEESSTTFGPSAGEGTSHAASGFDVPPAV